MTLEHLPPFELKRAGDAGEIAGYASVFGGTDAFGDRIAPGAFSRSLAEHRAAGTRPLMLWQHDATKPVGVWTSLAEDERGLKVVGRLTLDSTGGRDAYALLKDGAVGGLSIGFIARDFSLSGKSTIWCG